MVQRRSAVGLLFSVVFVTETARADCADGWFCDDARDAPAEAPEAPPAEPAPAAPPAKLESPAAPPAASAARPSGQTNEFGVTPPAREQKARRRAPAELGVNVHVEGAFLWSEDAHRSAGMAGFGAAFRFRPAPALGMDFGFDLAGGDDWNGNRRFERALVASALYFVNPLDPVQAYLLGGLALTGASVHVERRAGREVGPYDTTYTYFGLHAGVGLEFRVARRIGLDLDVIGALRGRTDENHAYDPEFVDPETRRVTNTSAFGLGRLGATFYF